MFSIAAAYEFLPVLRASVEYHFYDDKNAGMANDKQKFLTKGTNEYLAGIEFDVTKQLTLSCGGTKLPGTNVYSRTNKVFGLSADYSF